jgi:hypothetical protein
MLSAKTLCSIDDRVINECGAVGGNVIAGKIKVFGETCCSVTLSTTNPKRPDLGSIPIQMQFYVNLLIANVSSLLRTGKEIQLNREFNSGSGLQFNITERV